MNQTFKKNKHIPLLIMHFVLLRMRDYSDLKKILKFIASFHIILQISTF